MYYCLGSDHAGFDLKTSICQVLADRGCRAIDFGSHTGERIDYPVVAAAIARLVARNAQVRGVLICGTGIGMSIVANRFHGVRAALCATPEIARLARQHNDANILVLAGRFTPPEQAREILAAFLDSEFQGGRHAHRLARINDIEPAR